MRGEGGSNVDREGGEERHKPHLDERFEWSKKGLSSVESTKLHVCGPSYSLRLDRIEQRDGHMEPGGTPGPGLTWIDKTSPSG